MSPNYANYSLDELYDVLAHIDKQKYPENYHRLLDEIKRKNKSKEKASAEVNNNPTIITTQQTSTEKNDTASIIRLIIYIKLFIILGVLCLPAYFYSFLPVETFHTPTQYIAIVAAAITFITLHIYFHRSNKIKIIHKINKHIMILLLTSIFSISAYFMFHKCLPVLAHVYFLEHHKITKTVIIARKAHHFRKKHCNGKVYIKGYEYSELNYVCGLLSKETWKSLRAGDKIKLSGSESKLGFLAKKARKQHHN